MRFKILFIALAIITVFSSCKKDDETTGFLSGKITSADSGNGLADVLILVYNSDSNAQVGSAIRSDSDGNYTVELNPGNYYLKLYKQAFNSIPPAGMAAIPYNVKIGETTTADFKMYPSDVSNGGWITGKVTSGDAGIANVLVVANDGQGGFSSVTDSEGVYFIYNVPSGSYTVNSFIAAYNSTSANVDVLPLVGTSDVNLSLSQDASGSLSGHVTNLAGENIEVDVTLINPFTKEPIPGLSAMTSGGNYSLENIPDGTYIAQATYENDTKVMDPDWIIKNGEPIVVMTGNAETKDYSITGAVLLTGPTNASESAEPELLTTSTPDFTWSPYSSTSDYVVEVSDANGNVIWGGFSTANGLPVKNVVIDKAQTTVTFNFDGSASGTLEAGQVYRWRIYASKDDTQEQTGWKLISVSEDKMGLVKIAE